MQRVRCLTGHIGIEGISYATGDVFDVVDDVVANSLILDGDAEAVVIEGHVVVETSEPSTDAVPEEVSSMSTTQSEKVVESDEPSTDAVPEATVDAPAPAQTKAKRVYKRKVDA